MEVTKNKKLPIIRQFRRKNTDESFSFAFYNWHDMPEPKTWGFIEDFLPNYHIRNDVALSNDLICVLEDDWTRRRFNEYHPDYKKYSIQQLKNELASIDAKLYKEAEEYLANAIKSGEIEVREAPNNKDVFYCEKCGSTDVKVKEWFNPNTGENVSSDDDSYDESDCWCNNCNDNCSIVVTALSDYPDVLNEINNPQ